MTSSIKIRFKPNTIDPKYLFVFCQEEYSVNFLPLRNEAKPSFLFYWIFYLIIFLNFIIEKPLPLKVKY